MRAGGSPGVDKARIIVLRKKGFSLDTSDLPSVLRSHGLRVTPQRLAVLAALQATPDHPSAEEVFEEIREKMPSVSLATVYNALGELRRVGQLRALPVSGRVRYDLASRGPHNHLVCESCQRILYYNPPAALEDRPSFRRSRGRRAALPEGTTLGARAAS